MLSLQPVHVRVLSSSLSRLGLERNLRPLLNEVNRWLTNNGEEWTVDRLKHLKVLFLRSLAGEGKNLDWKWISHRGTLPTGAFRSVFKVGLKDARMISAALSVIQIYTAFRSPKLTDKQREKAYHSIVDRATSPCNYSLRNESLPFRRMFRKFYSETFSFAGWTTSKPTMVKRNLHPWIASFLECGFQGGPWTPILQSMGAPVQNLREKDTVGKISVIQEKGYKARVVASPNAAAQAAFRPLHTALGVVLKGLKTDCTHDQLSGARWAQEQLRQGKTLWSVDLSSATDRFPLEPQISVLQGLDYQWADQFRRMCTSLWENELHPQGLPIAYGRGQPMGLYGSFALFGLTHNLLLKKLGGTVDDYRVLGDDVVISNQELYWSYTEWLAENEVPISWHKTLIDAPIAEFAGYIITKDRLVKGVKYPDQLLDPYAFVQMTKSLGFPVYSVVPKGMRKYAMHISQLPEEFGGAGLNPHGLTMLERVEGYSTSLEAQKVPKLIGPNKELAMPMAQLVPGAREILLFLDDQSRKVTDIARRRLPLLSAMPDEVVVSAYMAVSRKGIPLWTTAGSPRKVANSWYQSMITRSIKPLWQGFRV